MYGSMDECRVHVINRALTLKEWLTEHPDVENGRTCDEAKARAALDGSIQLFRQMWTEIKSMLDALSYTPDERLTLCTASGLPPNLFTYESAADFILNEEPDTQLVT